MNPSAFATELSAIADEGLFRTNPVWCIERLVKGWQGRDASWVDIPNRLNRLLEALPRHGIRLAHTALVGWANQYGLLTPTIDESDPPRPGVVGLIVDIVCHDTLLVPLSTERSSEWHVDPTLPFRPARTLQELLVRLLHSLSLPHLHGVPERFAFTLRDPLGRRSDGPSMHLAGLLAVIRQANGNPALFDRACCVSQPDGDRLVPVGGIPHKLSAFRRECGSGTLLVRCHDAEAAAFDAHFDTVWEVDSLGELARTLEGEGLLQVFLDGQPLSGEEAKTVAARVHHLEGTEHRYAEALELSLRAERARYCSEVPHRIRREFRETIIDLYRHLGAYRKSAELAHEEHLRSRSSPIQSYEDQAHADLTYAASLYAPHRFAAIHELLDPWRERLTTDPLILTPLTRMKVFNTLGRAWVATGRDGWEGLFRRSDEILREVEPTDLPRTWSYWVQGLVKSGRLDEAEIRLDQAFHHPGLDQRSRWYLCVLQAEVARQRGNTWADVEMEEAKLMDRVGHPFAFYLQATARQPGRPVNETIDRFRRARAFLTQDEPDGDPQNIQRFLRDCILMAEAAWRADQTGWHQAVLVMHSYLTTPDVDSFANHYTGFIPSKDSAPSKETAERLLNRVPFF